MMFGLLFSWWTISSHFLPAASQADLGGRLLPLLGGGGSLQLEKLERAFIDGFILQARDLRSAAKTFDALVRVRRGTPWTEDTVVAVNMETSVNTWPDEKEQSGGGGGDGADDRGISVVAPDALDAFCEQHEGAIREFNARVESNFAYASSETMPPSTQWSADTFPPSSRGNNFITALHKLDHDREQLEYLVAKKRLPQEFERLAKEYGAVRGVVAAVLADGAADWQEVRGRSYGLGSALFERLRGTYNALIHVPREPAEGGLGGSHPTGFRRALNPNLDWNAIEEEYLSQELPLLWFDGFLSPEALEGVLEFCREATVFFETKHGYLGAYFNDGLTSPWLVQIAHELQERLPRVLEGMILSNLWAYKFDSDTSMDGIQVHADHATVNLNFWVTPDDANIDPSSGGLVVYPKAPPAETKTPGDSTRNKVDMNKWNERANVSSIESWLKGEGVYDSAVTVPYRQNRVVIFDSRLLHKSDRFLFKKGYENRRINLTFLFSPA